LGDLVKFPSHKVRKPKTDLATKQTKEKAQEIKENIFIEQIVEGLTLNLIHTLQENGVDMKKETFLRDLAIIIEATKSAIKRDFGKNHPMQAITDALAKISTLPNGNQVTDLNYGKVFVTKKQKVVKPPEDPLTTK
tara:strand:+ start:369 stop:776 length:408 start_codon:yes stop_codon:yes gene_type:complete